MISFLLKLFILTLWPLSSYAQTGNLIFNSGYEPGSRGNHNSYTTDILGTDLSVNAPNNWDTDLVDFGGFGFTYVCGDPSQRNALIVD